MIAGHFPGAWLTLANYAAAFTLCLFAAHRAGRSSRAWTAIAAVMLALLANKAFGIEQLVAAAGRALAKADGFYNGRRPFQAAAILAVLVALSFGLRRARRRMNRREFPLQLAGLCVIALSAFVAARALSFHYVDKFLALGPAVIKVNGLIENAVVGGIAVGAALSLRPRGRSSALRLRRT